MHRSRGAPQIQHPDEWPQIASQLRLLPHPQHGKLTHSKSNFTNGIRMAVLRCIARIPSPKPGTTNRRLLFITRTDPWAEETERRKADEMTQDVADDGNVHG